MRAGVLLPLVCASAGALCAGARAHDPGLSSCAVTLGAERTELVLTLANADAARLFAVLDRDRDGRLCAAEAAGPAAAAQVGAVLALGLPRPAGAPAPRVALEANADLRVAVILPGARELRLDLAWLDRLPKGHREYLVARDVHGAVLREDLLSRERRAVTLMAGAGSGAAASSFFLLGVEHVLTGYDHVLFLLALLVAASGLGAALRIITAFTVAHSLTLALATLQVVRVPGALVELVIALSIVWVGVENLLVRRPRARWLVTFGFGLVHGFGFAGALAELGITSGPRGVAWPLLAFNVGVEAGQLAIAAVALPALAWLGRRGAAVRWLRLAASLAVVIAGSAWAVARALG